MSIDIREIKTVTAEADDFVVVCEMENGEIYQYDMS